MKPNSAQDAPARFNRRQMLIGGGAGVGLIVGYALWPRQYAANLVAAKGEHVFGPWLKIAEDGKVIVAIAHSEMGQGVYTLLAQIIADELGADWRTVAVQPAMTNPLFANLLLAREWSPNFATLGDDAQVTGGLATVKTAALEESAKRSSFVVTAGSSSVRQFEPAARRAGAIARGLLCKAAAARWDTNWENCDTNAGFVTFGKKRLAFAELAAEAATLDPPDPVPIRPSPSGGLSGKDLLRLDVAEKVDGSANFAGDIRLPDMLYASVRAGPIGDGRLKSFNRKGANGISGLVTVISTDHWVAALASNWWAANSALDKMAPVFETIGMVADSGAMIAHLGTRFAKGKGWRLHEAGSVAATMEIDPVPEGTGGEWKPIGSGAGGERSLVITAVPAITLW